MAGGPMSSNCTFPISQHVGSLSLGMDSNLKILLVSFFASSLLDGLFIRMCFWFFFSRKRSNSFHLHWDSFITLGVCMCVRVWASLRECVSECVSLRVSLRVCVRACVCASEKCLCERECPCGLRFTRATFHRERSARHQVIFFARPACFISPQTRGAEPLPSRCVQDAALTPHPEYSYHAQIHTASF